MNVFTLLFSRSIKSDPGNFVFFKSFKKGFNNVKLHVFSNANDFQFNLTAERHTKQYNGIFTKLEKEVTHDDFILFLINTETEPFYIIDPDTIWFDQMPETFSKPLAGRYIPRFYDLYTEANTYDRLHTSCLYINPKLLKEQTSVIHFKGDVNLISPFIFYLNNKRYRFDTASQLFHFLNPISSVEIFNEDINKKFCHLFCGTNLEEVSEAYPELEEMHKLAVKDKCYAIDLKNKQDKLFNSLPWI